MSRFRELEGQIKKELANAEVKKQEAIESQIFWKGYKQGLATALTLMDAVDDIEDIFEAKPEVEE